MEKESMLKKKGIHRMLPQTVSGTPFYRSACEKLTNIRAFDSFLRLIVLAMLAINFFLGEFQRRQKLFALAKK